MPPPPQCIQASTQILWRLRQLWTRFPSDRLIVSRCCLRLIFVDWLALSNGYLDKNWSSTPLSTYLSLLGFHRGQREVPYGTLYCPSPFRFFSKTARVYIFYIIIFLHHVHFFSTGDVVRSLFFFFFLGSHTYLQVSLWYPKWNQKSNRHRKRELRRHLSASLHWVVYTWPRDLRPSTLWTLHQRT